MTLTSLSPKQPAATPVEVASTEGGWRQSRKTPSLSEVFGTIAVRPTGSLWRKLTAFLGPGYLVAVGYMDPGNWARPRSPAGRSSAMRC
jgi:manganese transport protein